MEQKWAHLKTHHMYKTFSLHLLVDRCCTTDALATKSLHSSLCSASCKVSHSRMPVNSEMLSSHLFFCLPVRLPPGTVLCKIVLAIPDELDTCPYHCSLYFSLWLGDLLRPNCLPYSTFVPLTSSLMTWSLYEIPVVFGNTSSLQPGFSFQDQPSWIFNSSFNWNPLTNAKDMVTLLLAGQVLKMTPEPIDWI